MSNTDVTYAIWQESEPTFGYGEPTTPHRKVYEGSIPWSPESPMGALDDLFRIFNIDHPADFTGHSLSVGDIVVLGETAFQCTRLGWERTTLPVAA